MKTFGTLTTLLMVIISLCITSCSNNDDGDSKSESIIGTWQSKDGDDFVITLKLDKNGSCAMITEEYYQGKWETYSKYGEYKYEDDILTFYEDGDIYSYTIVSITSKIMKLENDEGDTITFYKI